jgi:hypothetical protein
MGQISAILDDIRPKSVAEIKLRMSDHFKTNFGQKKMLGRHLRPIWYFLQKLSNILKTNTF